MLQDRNRSFTKPIWSLAGGVGRCARTKGRQKSRGRRSVCQAMLLRRLSGLIRHFRPVLEARGRGSNAPIRWMLNALGAMDHFVQDSSVARRQTG